MKYLMYILTFIIIFVFGIDMVYAAQCKPSAMNEINYLQGDYGDIGYCDLSVNNMLSSGCMPTAYAMVVANLTDSSVTPVTIRDKICNNSNLRKMVRGSSGNGPGTASYMLNNGTYALEVANEYDLTITKLSNTSISNIKNILSNNDTMIIASIKCPGGDSNDDPGCLFSTSSSGHYIVLSNVNENDKIVVLNPGSRKTAKNSYDDTIVQQNIINVLNQGMWQVVGNPSNCSKVSLNNSGTGGELVDDPHPDIFPDLNGENKENSCETIFVIKDEETGEESFTEFGRFMQDLFMFIKIATPVLVIILTTIDYIKAISSSNADELKKTNSKTIKRLIAGLIIFFLPFILDILFKLFGLYDLSRCNIGT